MLFHLEWYFQKLTPGQKVHLLLGMLGPCLCKQLVADQKKGTYWIVEIKEISVGNLRLGARASKKETLLLLPRILIE